MATLKLGQGHQNLINTFLYHNDIMIQCIMFGQEPSSCPGKLFGQNLTFQFAAMALVKVTKI